MRTTFRLNVEELDTEFIESLKKMFKNKEIEISIKEISETQYLLECEENRKHLLKAIENVNNKTNLINVDMDKLSEKSSI